MKNRYILCYQEFKYCDYEAKFFDDMPSARLYVKELKDLSTDGEGLDLKWEIIDRKTYTLVTKSE